MCIATDRSMNLRGDCHRLDLTAATWAQNLAIRSPLESGCHEDSLVVAICGIWPQNLANDQTPAPAILHWQFPCLLCHKFLTHDFLGVRQICGKLFRPKLYTNGFNWQTISWYYPFNLLITKSVQMYPVTPAALQGLPLTIAPSPPAMYRGMVYTADPYSSAYNALLSSMYAMNVTG
jgi:hypothetical protein